MTYILSSLASQLRSVITMSTGYAIALMSTMLMYILLPIILTDLRGETRAGVAIMLMTICQVFFFGPLAAAYTDRYGARRSMYGYVLFFIMAAIIWLLSGVADNIVLVSILISVMMIFFAAGYSCKMVEAYILRVNPAGSSGIAFGFLVTFAGLGRFVATLIQPYLVQQSYPRAAWIMIGAMIIFAILLSYSQDDATMLASSHTSKKQPADIKKVSFHSLISVLRQSYSKAITHGTAFIRRCNYFPLVPLSIALWEGIFFGSLWFIIPLYLAQHPDYISQGWEIGIYEIITVFVAVICGYLVDKRHTWRIVMIGWGVILVAGIRLIASPQIESMIIIGLLVALANNLIYSAGQHILATHDRDHEDDGAYSQIRQFVLNIGFMIMPLLWGYMKLTGNEQFAILGYINIIIAIISLGIVIGLFFRHNTLITRLFQNKKVLANTTENS